MESEYDNPVKVIVEVYVVFHRDGSVQPLSFVWEDETEYVIDKVKGVERAASLKAGGSGLRYTIVVSTGAEDGRIRETHLWRDDDTWFMERRGGGTVLDVHGRPKDDEYD